MRRRNSRRIRWERRDVDVRGTSLVPGMVGWSIAGMGGAGLWLVLSAVAGALAIGLAVRMYLENRELKRAASDLDDRRRDSEHQAMHDPLTGLPNRAFFSARLGEAIAASGPGSGVAVVVVDLDQLDEVNEHLGHAYGDRMVREMGPRLQRAGAPDSDLVARIGGDEFALLVPGVPDETSALEVANRILDVLERPLSLEGIALEMSVSIGLSMHPHHGEDAESLLRCAEIAVAKARESRSGYQIYAAQGERQGLADISMLEEIRPAMESGQFVLHFQPQADLATGSVRGVEGLLRWDHPSLGLIAPERFLPLVERTVLLRPLTLHVIDMALRQCAAWRRLGHEFTVAVNLPAHSLFDLELPEHVVTALAKWDVPASALRLEFAEQSLAANSVRSLYILARLSRAGVGLSVDDFGTGTSSLGSLKRLPVTEIKIDPSFVTNMRANESDETIVRAVIGLAHNLGMRVVAEGVQDQATWERLRELGCDLAQGFFVGRPVSAGELLERLTGSRA